MKKPIKLRQEEMEELIESLKRKEPEALSKVMKIFKNRIFNYVNLLVGNQETAEEITQDTFVKAYFKIGTLRTSNLSSWLYKIATNLARSEWRKNRLKKITSLTEVGENHLYYNSSIEEELFTEQLITSLQNKYRVPLVLRMVNNFSYEEIAKIMNKPVGTVKSLIFRGKEQLGERYKKSIGGKIERIGRITV
jgi:RNA polymerase sigma-70 factor (ECF subfamily)